MHIFTTPLEGTAYEEPREAGDVDETRDEKQAKKTKRSKKSKKLTTKKAKKTKQKNREGDEDDLQVEAKEFAFEAYQDPSLSPAQVVIIVQQLETESARAVAQQQLWESR